MAGVQPYGLRKLRACFVPLAETHELDSEIIVSFRILRTDANGLHQMGYRFFMLTLTSEFITQRIMSEVVVRHNLQRVIPQSDCVLPVVRLSPRYCAGRQNYRAGRYS